MRGIVDRGFDPTDDLRFGNAFRAPLFVCRVSARANAFQQLLRFPILGVVILHIASGVILHHREPMPLLALAPHYHPQGIFRHTIAHRPKQPAGLLCRKIDVAGRQFQRCLVYERNIGGPRCGFLLGLRYRGLVLYLHGVHRSRAPRRLLVLGDCRPAQADGDKYGNTGR